MTIALPNPPPAPIIASGAGWLVVEKPAGMSVHNDPGRDLCSLLKVFLESNKRTLEEINCDRSYGLHPVHRLDKETSGVILLACRRQVFNQLAVQFSRGLVIKHYLALVHGAVGDPGDQDLWQWPLTSSAGGRRSPQGRGTRNPSRTRCRVRMRSTHYTLLDCQPLTGRTHQIRRHAALAGHPIVGDQRYGSPRACRYVARFHNFTRLALHAASIGITPPGFDAIMTFESAGLPPEITKLIEGDKKD